MIGPKINPIPGTIGYGVSADGRIWSQRIRLKKEALSGIWREMHLTRDSKGYLRVRIRVSGESVTKKVHRIVFETFLGPIPAGLQINHKNGVKDDNRLENLEVCTQSENMRHADSLGLIPRKHGPDHHQSRFTPEQVDGIRRRYRSGGITQRELASEFGVSQTAIFYILKEKNWRPRPCG